LLNNFIVSCSKFQTCFIRTVNSSSPPPIIAVPGLCLSCYLIIFPDIQYEEQHLTKFNYFMLESKVNKLVKNLPIMCEAKTTTQLPLLHFRKQLRWRPRFPALIGKILWEISSSLDGSINEQKKKGPLQGPFF